MYQPRLKLEFVCRYCPPADGWLVFVDIDPSEEGLTGGKRTNAEARKRQRAMQVDAERVRLEFGKLGVQVGGNRKSWHESNGVPLINGDRDIVTFQKSRKLCLIAEVEGESSGQPEQKLYKAIGQIVMAASQPEPEGWCRYLALAVHGEKMAKLLKQAKALKNLGISGFAIPDIPCYPNPLIGQPFPWLR